MEKAIGVRLPEDVLEQIEKISEEEVTDRSTTIRKLIILGYQDFMKRRSAEEYLRGNITFSEAAHRAGLTLWEMEKYLVERGFRSGYSTEDLEREMRLLKK